MHRTAGGLVPVHAYLPRELARRLDRVAREQHRTKSSVIAECVDRQLRAAEPNDAQTTTVRT